MSKRKGVLLMKSYHIRKNSLSTILNATRNIKKQCYVLLNMQLQSHLEWAGGKIILIATLTMVLSFSPYTCCQFATPFYKTIQAATYSHQQFNPWSEKTEPTWFSIYQDPVHLASICSQSSKHIALSFAWTVLKGLVLEVWFVWVF